jgi:hypothetical protein
VFIPGLSAHLQRSDVGFAAVDVPGFSAWDAP